jgi:hypothetical protein
MKTKLFLILSMASVALASCTKYPPNTGRLTEDMAIYTKYDITVNFNNYKTFAIVPSVAYIDGNDTSYVTDGNAMALLGRITQNMIDRGFVQVKTTGKPDLGINAVAVKTTNTTVYYPGWYWGYYPPNYWGYPSYGYGYPYYPTYISSYSAGSVIIDLVDFKYPTDDNKLMVRWNVFIRGLLTGTHTQDDVLQSVDQAFAQTPALATK